MTTTRGLLRRLISRGRIDPSAPSADAGSNQRVVEHRLEAARQRLKQAIPPPVEEPPQPPGQAIPPPEGVSPGQESPPVP